MPAIWVWTGAYFSHGSLVPFHLAGAEYCSFSWCNDLSARCLLSVMGHSNVRAVFYSHRVRTVAQHRIVASGPYRFTRHPAYAGMIIANAGISIYFFNRVTICVFLFILVPAVLLRIVIEERTLFGIEGYAEFAKKRKRLFPAVW